MLKIASINDVLSQYIKVSVLGVLNSDPIKLPLFLKNKKNRNKR